MTNQDKINIYFNKLQAGIEHVPAIVANTAIENFQNNFFKQSFDGIPWLKAKDSKADRQRLLRDTGKLFNSINASLISSNRVIISAGGSQIPYARIHNEGGTITRDARTETFVRNRDAKKRFTKGTTKGRGFTFSSYTYTMPKRQFMGITETLKNQIRERILKKLKE